MSLTENDRVQQQADAIDNEPASLNSILQMIFDCQNKGILSLYGHTTRMDMDNFPYDYRFFVAPNPPILDYEKLVEFAQKIASQYPKRFVNLFWDELPYGYLYRIPEIRHRDDVAGYKITRVAYPKVDEELAKRLDFRPVHLNPLIIPHWLRVDSSVKVYPHPELAEAAHGKDLGVAHANADYSYLAAGFIHERWIRNIEAGRDISHASLLSHIADAAIGLIFSNYPPESV